MDTSWKNRHHFTHGIRMALLGAAVAVLGGWITTTASAEEVSRKAPPIYREKLQGMLTPIDEVLKASSSLKDDGYDGATLLDEVIHYIDEKGRRYFVDHRVLKAFTESGVNSNAEEVHSYRKANQKIHLVSAQTILPDGKRMPIRPGAAILQSPQRQADYSLYDDKGELRLIFPNIKPGAITESIVVVEESQFRIPGEFTGENWWAYGWPTQRARRIVEMPDALAGRLRSFTLGQGIPEMDKQPAGKGRTRMTWQATDLNTLPNEGNRPPTDQIGPVLRLTTLPDWDAMVKWYAPLVQQKSKLQPSLAKQVDEWTKDAKSPVEILNILMTRVARDVRYTGLEFGTSDLQPHDCNEVWENQYGDCKDKANLLRTMLARKGIVSHLTLLNTEHIGYVDRRCPDYRQFDHAILTVELEPGKYVFCDPTISYAKPGQLSPSDADRDVLLVKDAGATWARTPAQNAGELRYDFEIKLTATGELSGWLTQESEGYYGVSHAGYYQGLDKDRLKENARNLLRGFYKGGDLVDVTRMPIEEWKGTYRTKSYFVVAGGDQDSQAPLSVDFPQASSLFVDPGLQKKRKTDYYVWPDTVKVNARIKLPEGSKPAALPRPFHITSKTFTGEAKWSLEGDELRATLVVRMPERIIPPEEFEVFSNALQSLHSWLDKPLNLTPAGDQAAPQAAPGLTLEDFPMMPNGDGQLRLVEQRFPASRDPALRREALQKVIQYFPKDNPTIFAAKMKLILMDWDDDNPQEAVNQLEALLRASRDGLTVDNVAWAEYVIGLGLKDLKKTAEAMKLFERVGGNTAVAPYWRAWSAFQRAKILEEKSATNAIKALREALAFDADAKPSAFVLLCKLLIVDGRMADFKKEVRQLLEKKPARYLDMMAYLAESADDLLPSEKVSLRDDLIAVLEEAQKSAELGKRFENALQNSRENISALTAADRIRDGLTKQLAKAPAGDLEALTAQFKTRAELARAIQQAEKDRKPDLCVKYGLALLTRFEPDADFAAHLWAVTSHAEWKERFEGTDETVLPILFDLCEQLPPDNDAHVDSMLLRARGFERRGDIESAQKVHEKVLQLPKLTPGFQVVAQVRLARNLEDRHDYKRAIALYRDVEAKIDFRSVPDALLRAAFLQLEMGSRDEGVRILNVLATRKEGSLANAQAGTQILECVGLIKDPAKAANYWDASAKWWPKWLELEGKLGLKVLGDEQIVPVVEDLQALGAAAGNALRTKDRTAFATTMRTLAHAARWQPSMVIELHSLLIYGPGMFPEQVGDVREFMLTMAENFASENLELKRKNLMYTAIAYIDSSKSARALETIHAFNELTPVDDPISHGMARLWGMAAQGDKKELAAAIAALEKAVASPNLQDSALTVTYLANAYRKADRGEDEEKLLKKEIENPKIKAVPADLQTLTARYQQLREAGEDARKFTVALEQWLKTYKPSWFDFAEPKSLEDPRLANLDEVLNNPGQVFIDPEIIKLQILIASSPSQPFERRQQVFLGALYRLEDLALTTEQARAVVEPIVNDEGFTDWLRIEMLWRALINARTDLRADDFEKLRGHAFLSKFNDNTKASVQTLKEAMEVEGSSPAKIAEYCDRLIGHDINQAALTELRHFYSRLLSAGEIELAEKIYRRLGDARIAPDLQMSKAGLQMEFLKWLNQTKRWTPVASAMKSLVLNQYPAEAIQKPEILDRLHDRGRFDWLDENEARQIFLYKLKSGQISADDFRLWGDFIQDLPKNAASRKLSLDLIAAALQNAPGDAERALVVDMATSVIDNDDVELTAALTELMKPYRKADEHPQTFAEIRESELHNCVRRGEPIDFETDFAKVKNSNAAASGRFERLRHYVQTREIEPLRKTLEAIGTDELLGDRLLAYAVPAFRLTKMSDELELAKEVARKTQYRSVLSSWASKHGYHYARALNLAEAIEDPSALPAEWVADALATLGDRRLRASLVCFERYLRKDWTESLKSAEEGINGFPTYYHFQWYKGANLYQMGRKQEALAPLRIYTRYAKDELEYPQAVEWLKEIEAAGQEAAATPQ